MRTSEWIAATYVVYLVLVAWMRPTPASVRARLTVWAAVILTTIATLGAARPSALVAILRDWVPAAYLLLGYWLSGLLFSAPQEKIERWLLSIDRSIFDAARLDRAIASMPRAILEYVEATYLSCYALVPAGFATLFFTGHARDADRFWSIVLLAALASYAMLPWIQTRPPRSIEPPSAMDRRAPRLRRLNHQVLQHGSIHANTIPSGHAAASLATALAVAPAGVGAVLIFAWFALGIASASVLGRYHYLVDAVLGLLVACLAWSAVAGGLLPTA